VRKRELNWKRKMEVLLLRECDCLLKCLLLDEERKVDLVEQCSYIYIQISCKCPHFRFAKDCVRTSSHNAPILQSCSARTLSKCVDCEVTMWRQYQWEIDVT